MHFVALLGLISKASFRQGKVGNERIISLGSIREYARATLDGPAKCIGVYFDVTRREVLQTIASQAVALVLCYELVWLVPIVLLRTPADETANVAIVSSPRSEKP